MGLKEDLKEQAALEDHLRIMQLKHANFAQDTAQHFGVSVASISKWENGIVRPCPEFRSRIMEWIVDYGHEY